MTTSGWLFMGICWGVLAGVVIYSYRLVLFKKEGWSQQDHDPTAGTEGQTPPVNGSAGNEPPQV